MNTPLVIYHEIKTEQLGSILVNGITRRSRGSKSRDDLIIKTDSLIDNYRPTHLRAADIGRSKVVYGYIGTREYIIDIKDGKKISLQQKMLNNTHALLQLDVYTELCYVSNLNLYDKIKHAINRNLSETELRPHILNYWESLVPLDVFSIEGMIERPEVMIAHDITPASLRVLSFD